MILCDREILEAVREQRIVIDPEPDLSLTASTSVDLRLALPLERWAIPGSAKATGLQFRPGHPDWSLDEVSKDLLKPVDLIDGGYSVEAGCGFILGWTYERIYLPHTSRLCARVEGKSSLARLGLGVHVTAPTIHAGFGFNKHEPKKSGAQLRLEIWNAGPLPIEVRPMMRVCQLILEEVRERPSAGYEGQFNLQGPRGSPGT